MTKSGEIKNFGDIVIFDKRFKGVSKDKQKQVVSFKHVSAETLKKLIVEEGDVRLLATGLFSGYTTKELAGNNLNTGEVITIPTGGNANIKYHSGDFVDSGNILCVAKDNSVYLKYVYYGLLSQNDYLESCFKGTGIHHPYMPDIWETKIPFLCFEEQKRIVSHLDTQFAKIDQLKAYAATQLQAAKALFQSALKDLLTPKEGWKEVSVTKLGDSKIGPFGSLLHKKDYIVGGIPLINPMHIQYGRIVEDVKYTITLDKAKELRPFSLLKNDIIIGRRGEMGRCAVIGEREEGWICGTGSLYFRPNTKVVEPKFLQLSISSEKYVKELEKLAGGATMLNLSSKAFSQLAFYLPSLHEQQSIVSRLDTISEKVKALQANYDQTINLCNDLKQSLLKSIFA